MIIEKINIIHDTTQIKLLGTIELPNIWISITTDTYKSPVQVLLTGVDVLQEITYSSPQITQKAPTKIAYK